MTQRTLAAAAAIAMMIGSPIASEAQARSCKTMDPLEIRLSGPRFGITYLSPGIIRALRDSLRTDYNAKARRINAITTQFGWQFERQFAVADCGPSALTEAVLLVGGMEQGLVIPSASFLVGMRMPRGAEFGVGPNLSPAGVALAFAGGSTVHYGYLDFPMTLALVPGQEGARLSFLTGFIIRRERSYQRSGRGGVRVPRSMPPCSWTPQMTASRPRCVTTPPLSRQPSGR
jgi:hypothetical protein